MANIRAKTWVKAGPNWRRASGPPGAQAHLESTAAPQTTSILLGWGLCGVRTEDWGLFGGWLLQERWRLTQVNSTNNPGPGPGSRAFQASPDLSSQLSGDIGTVDNPVVQVWKLAPRGSGTAPGMEWGGEAVDSYAIFLIQFHTSTKIHHRRKTKGFVSNPLCAFTLIFTTVSWGRPCNYWGPE